MPTDINEFITNYVAGADIRTDRVDLAFDWLADDGQRRTRAFTGVTVQQAITQALVLKPEIRQELAITIIRACARLVAAIDSQ